MYIIEAPSKITPTISKKTHNVTLFIKCENSRSTASKIGIMNYQFAYKLVIKNILASVQSPLKLDTATLLYTLPQNQTHL